MTLFFNSSNDLACVVAINSMPAFEDLRISSASSSEDISSHMIICGVMLFVANSIATPFGYDINISPFSILLIQEVISFLESIIAYLIFVSDSLVIKSRRIVVFPTPGEEYSITDALKSFSNNRLYNRD